MSANPTLDSLCERAEALLNDLRAMRGAETWTPKFKVGDRVRVKPIGAPANGPILKVVNLDRRNVQTVNAETEWTDPITGASKTGAWWDESELELIPWSLPAPPEGREWANPDGWTEEMLSGGWRPVLKGEIYQRGTDEILLSSESWDVLNHGGKSHDISGRHDFIRTRRPLPDPEREAFEAWAKDYYTTRPITWEADIKQYDPPSAHAAWLSWQASAARA